MPHSPHIEKHFTSSEMVRDIVIGMSDGLTVPFALAAGLSGSVTTTNIIIAAGLAEVAAGSIAMGLGGFLAAKTDAEHFVTEREREVILARSKKWAENNPGKVRQAKTNNLRKRRAARHTSRRHFTVEEFKELCARYGNKCLACGDTEAVLEADHVVPLVKGGSDSINNIQPLCGSCNRKTFVNIIDYRLNTNILSQAFLSESFR